MQERSKLQSYLGFSIRAGKLVMGVNAIECTRKRIYALVMCSSAAKNTRKDAEKLRDRLQVPLCIADNLAELVKKENCKLCALLDRSLAGAVIGLFADEAIAPKPRREESGDWEMLTSEEEPVLRPGGVPKATRGGRAGERPGTAGRPRREALKSAERTPRNTSLAGKSGESGRECMNARGDFKTPAKRRAEHGKVPNRARSGGYGVTVAQTVSERDAAGRERSGSKRNSPVGGERSGSKRGSPAGRKRSDSKRYSPAGSSGRSGREPAQSRTANGARGQYGKPGSAEKDRAADVRSRKEPQAERARRPGRMGAKAPADYSGGPRRGFVGAAEATRRGRTGERAGAGNRPQRKNNRPAKGSRTERKES